jgi:thiamine pyrophosphokinase
MVIAADGGLKWLSEAGIAPDFIIGDFDSHPIPEPGINAPIIRLEREKDETDMLSAIKLGYGKGLREFHIHGGTGGRPDHTFANIQCLVYLSRNNAAGFLFFKDYFMTALTNGKTEIEGREGEYISVFAYGGEASGISLTGLKYSLTGASLSDDAPIGTSNEFTHSPAHIAVNRGTVIITCPTSASVKF